MPAKNRKTRVRKPKKTTSKRNMFLLILLIAITVAFLWKYILPSSWDKAARLALAVENKSDQDPVKVLVFDPATDSITSILIPASTELNVAHNLGVWPAGSVKRLAENENIDGSLLSKTITKSFEIPIEHWADNDAEGFEKGGINSLKAAFSFYSSSLTLKDKVNLALFTFKFQNVEEIDLKDTSLLKKTQLTGGGEGYVLEDAANHAFLSKLFIVPTMLQNPLKVKIVSSKGGKAVENISNTISVLGAKTLSVESIDGNDANIDTCVVNSPQNSLVPRLISKIYNCKLNNNTPDNFDIEILLNEKFFSTF